MAKKSSKPRAKGTKKTSYISRLKNTLANTQYQQNAVYLIGLAGLLPAVSTNYLPLLSITPFAESFSWARFDLGFPDQPTLAVAWRVAFLVLAAAVLLLRQGASKLITTLIVAPLLLAGLHPTTQIGATINYAKIIDSRNLGQEFANTDQMSRLAELSARQGGPIELLNVLPPYLPSVGWLEAKYNLTAAALAATAGNTAELDRRISDLTGQIAAMEIQRESVQRLPMLPGGFGNLIYRQPLAEAKRALAKLKADRQAINARNLQLADKAAPLVVEYEASVRLHERWVEDKRNLWIAAPYLLACSTLLVWFVWYFGVLNPVFGVAAFLWLAGSLANAFWVWKSSIQLWLYAAIYPVAAGILVAVCLRLAFRIYLDNKDIYEKIPQAKRRGFHLKAALLLAPFLVVVATLTWGQSWLIDKTWEKIYCNDTEVSSCLNLDGVAVYNSDPNRNTKRDDVHLTLDAALVRLELRMAQASADAQQGTAAAIQSAQEKAKAAFREVFAYNVWDYEGVDVPDFDYCIPWPFGDFNAKNCAYYFAMKPINAVYQRQVSRLEQWYYGKIDALASNALATIDTAASTFQNGIAGMSGPMAAEAKKHADFGFLILALLELQQAAFFLLVCGRALVTIQGRLFAAVNPRAIFSMDPPGFRQTEMPNPAMSSQGQSKLEMQAADARGMRVKRGYSIDNANQTTLFIPAFRGKWAISRMLRKCLWLKEITPKKGSAKVQFTVGGSREFVRFTIPEGSAVVFRWKNFVAASPTIKLRRLMTMRMPFVSLGHIMLPVAHGPGILIIRSHGKTRLSNNGSDVPTVDPYRLLAFSLASRFSILSVATTKSVYLDEAQIYCASKAFAALDATDPNWRTTGVISQFWRLLRP